MIRGRGVVSGDKEEMTRPLRGYAYAVLECIVSVACRVLVAVRKWWMK